MSCWQCNLSFQAREDLKVLHYNEHCSPHVEGTCGQWAMLTQ